MSLPRGARIAVLGFMHETNTFVAAPTTRADVAAATYRGPRIAEVYGGGRSSVAGLLAAGEFPGVEVVPLVFCTVEPWGRIEHAGFEAVLAEMIRMLEREKPWDAVLLALHGAAVTDGTLDADGDIIRHVRKTVGRSIPIGVVLDMHANISFEMVEHSTIIVTYRTNPHIDARDRALECAELTIRAARSEIHPLQSLERPPAAVNILRQNTSEEPLHSILEELNAVLGMPNVLSASFALGYQYADVPKMGIGCLVIHDGSIGEGARHARSLAASAWERREQFIGHTLGVDEAMTTAAESPEGPVVLLDIGDNIGGGGPGDSTVLLDAAIRRGVTGLLTIIWDESSVERCIQAREGNEVDLAVGGRHGPGPGPVMIHGRVRRITDGHFEEATPTHAGFQRFDAGPTAVVDTEKDRTIVLTTRRIMPVALAQLTAAGVDPARYRVIVAKGVQSPKPAYGRIARQMLMVDTPGATMADFTRLPFERRRYPMFPFEPDAVYQ